MSASAIASRSLTKRYGDKVAVDSLDLTVREGEIYAFLGRNGAGKTTTIRMLLGLVRPSGGEVHVLGRRIVPGETGVFRRIGSLVESATSYPNLTVWENLDVHRRLTGSPKAAVAESIERLHLEAYADRHAGQLSLGNKQRLALARALLHRPELLVLDEPANALDPAGIMEIRELLKELVSDRGVTVFMSSHILAEVAHLADRIGVVHEGRLVEEVDRRELHARARAYVDVRVDDPARAAALLSDAGFGEVERCPDGQLRVLDATEERSPHIGRLLIGAGIELSALTPRREDLESYFVRLTEGSA